MTGKTKWFGGWICIRISLSLNLPFLLPAPNFPTKRTGEKIGNLRRNLSGFGPFLEQTTAWKPLSGTLSIQPLSWYLGFGVFF